jgi:hypothetical protein
MSILFWAEGHKTICVIWNDVVKREISNEDIQPGDMLKCAEKLAQYH